METKTVLIVDDSSLARMLMRKIFSTQFKEWKVLEAKEAQEALVHLQSATIQLALVDYNMPGMNGIDLAEQLMQQQPHMSIHLVTANIQERMRLRAEAIGIGFIKKPISRNKIANVLL